MKMKNADLLLVATSFWSCILTSNGFLATPPTTRKFASRAPLFSTTEEEKKTEAKPPAVEDGTNYNEPVGEVDPDAEGLPWWWSLVWKLDMMQKGEEGKPIIFGDSANVLRTNIEQIYGGYPSLDGCPLAGKRMEIEVHQNRRGSSTNRLPCFLFNQRVILLTLATVRCSSDFNDTSKTTTGKSNRQKKAIQCDSYLPMHLILPFIL